VSTPRHLSDEEYLRKLRVMMREAVKETQRLDAKWNKINDEINDHFRRENERRLRRGEFPLTDLMKAQQKADSLALKDAFAGGQWWRGKAVYLAEVIQAEIAMREAGL
jgi:hypothetical protein